MAMTTVRDRGSSVSRSRPKVQSRNDKHDENRDTNDGHHDSSRDPQSPLIPQHEPSLFLPVITPIRVEDATSSGHRRRRLWVSSKVVRAFWAMSCSWLIYVAPTSEASRLVTCSVSLWVSLMGKASAILARTRMTVRVSDFQTDPYPSTQPYSLPRHPFAFLRPARSPGIALFPSSGLDAERVSSASLSF